MTALSHIVVVASGNKDPAEVAVFAEAIPNSAHPSVMPEIQLLGGEQ